MWSGFLCGLGIRRKACSCLVISFQFDSGACCQQKAVRPGLREMLHVSSMHIGQNSERDDAAKYIPRELVWRSRLCCACPCRIMYGLLWNGWYFVVLAAQQHQSNVSPQLNAKELDRRPGAQDHQPYYKCAMQYADNTWRFFLPSPWLCVAHTSVYVDLCIWRNINSQNRVHPGSDTVILSIQTDAGK